MTFLIKATAAFGLAAFLTGTVHLDTPRLRAMAAELHAAQPHAALAHPPGRLPAHARREA
jgi:hypothetical protein